MTDDRALHLLASLPLEDGRLWGDAATELQWADARAILGGGPRLHFVTRPRGGSKTTDVAAVVLAALVTQLGPDDRAYGFATDGAQARLLLDAKRGFVMRAGLQRLVKVDAMRAVVTRAGGDGPTFEAWPADGPGAFGLRPALVVVDEFGQWPSTPSALLVWEAVWSAMGKRPDSRLVIITSAGAPSHHSHTVLRTAQSSSAWRVSEMPGPVPWIRSEDLAEQERLLTPSQFARLHLNQWTEPEDSLAASDEVRRCAVLDGPQQHRPGVRYVMGLDVGLRNDRTVLTVMHAEPASVRWDGGEEVGEGVRWVLDRLHRWVPSRGREVDLTEVEATILEAHRGYGRPDLVFDPYQAVGLAQRLRTAGVTCREFTFTASSVGRLALGLYQALKGHRLALPDDEDLLSELEAVRLRETSPGVYRLDHAVGGHDDQAVAVALALHGLSAGPEPAVAWSARYTIGGRGSPGTFERHGSLPGHHQRLADMVEASRRAEGISTPPGHGAEVVKRAFGLGSPGRRSR